MLQLEEDTVLMVARVSWGDWANARCMPLCIARIAVSRLYLHSRATWSHAAADKISEIHVPVHCAGLEQPRENTAQVALVCISGGCRVGPSLNSQRAVSADDSMNAMPFPFGSRTSMYPITFVIAVQQSPTH